MRTSRVVAVLMSCVTACRPGDSSPLSSQTGRTVIDTGATVTVTRPTVIAYFVIPPGAVDTLPDLAVEADDWNVSMATLGDSLEANGIGLAIVTDSTLRVGLDEKRDTTIALGPFRSSGYVFVRPGGPTCVRGGGADVDTVLAMARAVARGSGCA